MRFSVDHCTTYRYDGAVTLGPHTLRLTPRAQAGVTVESFELDIVPAPVMQRSRLDEHGNVVTEREFDGSTDVLVVHSRCVAQMRAAAEPSSAVPAQPPARSVAPAIAALGAEVAARSMHARRVDPHDFASHLTEVLHARVAHRIREHGAPQAPEETLRLGAGACRDLAVLFCAVCHAQGVPARFVSGYWIGREPGLTAADRRWMHAWAEVHAPGSGWRGFDPSHGRMVADGHLALAAAFDPAGAAPIEGSYYGDARSTLSTALTIDVQS